MASRRSFLFRVGIEIKMNSVGSNHRGNLVRSRKPVKKNELKNALAVGADFVTVLGFFTSQFFQNAVMLSLVSIMDIWKKLF